MGYLYFTYNNNWSEKNIIKLNYNTELYNLETDNDTNSEYVYVYKIILTKNYILPFSNPLDIFHYIIKNKKSIEKLEKLYNTEFYFIKELTKFIHLTNTSNIFIDDVYGIGIFQNMLNYEFPILGIDLKKKYNIKEIIEMNDYMLLTYLINFKKNKENNEEIFNKFYKKQIENP